MKRKKKPVQRKIEGDRHKCLASLSNSGVALTQIRIYYGLERESTQLLLHPYTKHAPHFY